MSIKYLTKLNCFITIIFFLCTKYVHDSENPNIIIKIEASKKCFITPQIDIKCAFDMFKRKKKKIHAYI